MSTGAVACSQRNNLTGGQMAGPDRGFLRLQKEALRSGHVDCDKAILPVEDGNADCGTSRQEMKSGNLRRLESRNGILGCLSETTPSEPSIEVELSPGDRLILYTDGLVEVLNCLDDMLGVEGLEDLVLQLAKLPLADMQKTIVDGVAAWRHGPLADDVSLVIVEVR